jgi:prepilin-type N-terminal cleavage/methylation domain-containing protein
MARAGFSLIELMVAVAIAATLALVAAPNYQSARDQAANVQLAANVRAVQVALEEHAGDHRGAYPLTVVDPALLAYLPGRQLPRAPWYAKPQAVACQFNGPGQDFNDAQWPDLVGMARARAFAYGSLGGPSGRMGDVAAAPAEVDQIGLLRMNVDLAARTYRLFAQGKRDQYRIIVAPVSNDGR